MKNLKITGIIGFLFQLIFSIATVVLLLIFDILPAFYIFLTVFVLTLCLVISAIFIIARSRLRVTLGMVFAFLMSIIMAVASIKFILPAMQTLDKITGSTTTYSTTYYVLTKKNDQAQKIEDIKDYKIGVEKTHDFEAMQKALNDLAARLDHQLNFIAYDDYNSMWNAFIADKAETGAILMDASFYSIYDNMYQEHDDLIENYVKIIDKITIEVQKDTNPDDASRATPTGSLTQRPFAIYISGLDVSGSINTRSRSDVNIVMAVNPITKNILLVTVPRDTYVPLSGITTSKDKLTHAGIYGANDCAVSIKTLEQYIYPGVHIDHWIRVNFTSVEKIVDTLGGVNVYSAYDYTATFNGRGDRVHFNKGMNYMNGHEALTFCRERKTIPGEEQQRGRNQLEVIKGIFNKATSPSMIANYNELLKQVQDNFLTDLSTEDITNLVKMQLNDNAGWTFETASVDVEYIYDYCYSMPGQKLCVGIMDEASRKSCTDKLVEVLSGKK